MAGHSTPAVSAAHSSKVRRFFAALGAYAVVLVAGAVAAGPAGAQGGMTLCHATGNPGQPYIEITVGPDGPGPHGVHEGDIIPAPAGGCPTSTEPAPTPTPAPTVEPTPTATPAPQETPAPSEEPVAQPEERSSQNGEDEGDGQDGGGSRSDRDGRGGGDGAGRTRAQAAPQAPAPTAAPATTHTHPVRATLPFTGIETPIIAMTGLGLLMMGAGLRLRNQAART